MRHHRHPLALTKMVVHMRVGLAIILEMGQGAVLEKFLVVIALAVTVNYLDTMW